MYQLYSTSPKLDYPFNQWAWTGMTVFILNGCVEVVGVTAGEVEELSSVYTSS